MARFVLAIVFVAILVSAFAVLALGAFLTRRAVTANAVTKEDRSPMQKIAFALLVALILYVAVQGAVA